MSGSYSSLCLMNCHHLLDEPLIDWRMLFQFSAHQLLLQHLLSSCHVFWSPRLHTGMQKNLLEDVFLCPTALDLLLNLGHYWRENLNSLGIIISKECCDSFHKRNTKSCCDLLVPALETDEQIPTWHHPYWPSYPPVCTPSCCPSSWCWPPCPRPSGWWSRYGRHKTKKQSPPCSSSTCLPGP